MMSKKPILYTLLAAPVFAIVSTPLAFLAAALYLIFFQTDWGHVYPGDATLAVAVFAAMMAIFTLYGTIATWKHTSEKYGSAA